MPFEPKVIRLEVIADTNVALQFLIDYRLDKDAQQLSNLYTLSAAFSNPEEDPIAFLKQLEERQEKEPALAPFIEFVNSLSTALSASGITKEEAQEEWAASITYAALFAIFVAYSRLPEEQRNNNIYTNLLKNITLEEREDLENLYFPEAQEKPADRVSPLELEQRLMQQDIIPTPTQKKETTSVTQDISSPDSKIIAPPPIITPQFNPEDVTTALTHLEKEGLDQNPGQLAELYEVYCELITGRVALHNLDKNEPFNPFVKHVYEATRARLPKTTTSEQIISETLNTIRLALFIDYARLPRKQQDNEIYRRMHAGIDQQDYANLEDYTSAKKELKDFKDLGDIKITSPEERFSAPQWTAPPTPKNLTPKEIKALKKPPNQWKKHTDEITQLYTSHMQKKVAGEAPPGSFNAVEFSSADVVRQGSNTAMQVAISHPHKPDPKQISQNEKALKLLMYHGLHNDPHFASPLMYEKSGARISERAKSDLFDALTSKTPTPYSQFIGYIDQAIGGIAKLHENNTAHRDIKPGNMLVDSDGRLLISDLDTLVPVNANGQGCTIDPNTGKPGEKDNNIQGIKTVTSCRV